MNRAQLIVDAFKADHDVNLYYGVIAHMKDVTPIIRELEELLRDAVPRAFVQRLTQNEYIIHPYRRPIVFTVDTDTSTDAKAHFINLSGAELREATPELIDPPTDLLLIGIDEEVLGNSFVIDSGEFNSEMLKEAVKKFSDVFDRTLVSMEVSVHESCPIAGAIEDLDVEPTRSDEFGLPVTTWNRVVIVYQEYLKAGQAILEFGDGSKSLLIRDPSKGKWLLIKDTNLFIKDYIAGIQDVSEV